MSDLQQRTLAGGEAPPRERPETLLVCPACEDIVLRSNRFNHEHDMADADTAESKLRDQITEQLDIPAADLLETAVYEVTFYYEMREVVQVEASDKHEAKRRAEDVRRYDGEITHTLHTEREQRSDRSEPTIDYLERYGMVEDDYDLQPADIARVMNSD